MSRFYPLVTLFIIVVAVSSVVQADDIRSLSDEGNRLYGQGDYTGALAVYDRALELSNDSYPLWIARGNTLVRLGRLSDAEEAYNKSILINPQAAAAWSYKGYVLSSMGKSQEALDAYGRAIEINPKNPHFLVMKATELYGRGDYQDAISTYHQAVVMNPEDTLALTGEGICLSETGKYEEALFFLNQSVVLDPNSVLTWDYLGRTYMKMGDPKNATSAFDRAVTLDPSDTDLKTRRNAAATTLAGSDTTTTAGTLPVIPLAAGLIVIIVAGVVVFYWRGHHKRGNTESLEDIYSTTEDFITGGQAAIPGSHHEVFISYSSKDKPIADAICAKLEADRVRCWIAPRDVLPGTSFPNAIISAIDESRIMVLIFSSFSNKSPHVIRELTRAVNRGVIIIPFRIEDVEMSKDMEYLIAVPHWLDAMTRPLEQHLEELVQTVQAILTGIKEREIKKE